MRRSARERRPRCAWPLRRRVLRSERRSVRSLSSQHASVDVLVNYAPPLNALTSLLARELLGERILVNAVCPGPGVGDVVAAARSIAWAATLGENGPTGGFFRDGAPIAW